MGYMGIDYLRNKLAQKQSRVNLRYNYYEMKNAVRDFNIMIPKQWNFLTAVLGWSTKAVDALADRIVFREFANDNFDINSIFQMNSQDVFVDSAILSACIASCSFVYISADEVGFPRLQVIDGYDATGIIDEPTRLLKEGYAVNEFGFIYMEPYKYLTNFLDMWYLTVLLLIGVVLVLFGIGKTILSNDYVGGIWPAGIGTVLTVLALLLSWAWNNTAYYPSTADLQSSLTLSNSCSSEFTLTTMFYVSLLVPFVLAYIIYCWRAINSKKLTKDEIKTDHAY